MARMGLASTRSIARLGPGCALYELARSLMRTTVRVLHKLQLKNPANAGFFNCREWDSNPYAFRRGILSPLCIPFHHRGGMSVPSL